MKGYMSMCLVDSRSECNGDLIHFPGKLIRTPAVCTPPPSPLPPTPHPHLRSWPACCYTFTAWILHYLDFQMKVRNLVERAFYNFYEKEGNQQMLRQSSRIRETKSKITKLITTDTVAAIRKVSSIWLVWNPQEYYPLRNSFPFLSS